MRILIAAAFLLTMMFAATPAREKEFVDTYKRAFESGNGAALTALLYTKGADPKALEFYKMMMTSDMGGKISSIDLVALTPEDTKRLEKSPSPDGRPMKMVLTPVKK